MSEPTGVEPKLREGKKKSNLLNACLIVAAILVVLMLTGMVWNIQLLQSATPGTTPTPIQTALSTTTQAGVTNNADETSGIILAGAFLVLIILGGTLGATRRKR